MNTTSSYSNTHYTFSHNNKNNMHIINGNRGPENGQLNLPPGFRFYPSDEELVVHYLCRKAASQHFPIPIIAEIDLYKFDPWDLPEKALFGEKEWYFFSPRDRKYPNGSRPNRAAGSGYWKATGTDKPITINEGKRKVGVKKALVFYTGKAPKGDKTNWIMHEYRLADSASKAAKRKGSTRLDDWVLCRIYKKLPSATKLAMKEANFEIEGCEDAIDHKTFPKTENEKEMNAPRLNSSFTASPLHNLKMLNEVSNNMEEKSTKIVPISYNWNSNFDSNQALHPMYVNYYRNSNQHQMPFNRNKILSKGNILSNVTNDQNEFNRSMITKPTLQTQNLSLQASINTTTETQDSPVNSSIVNDDYSLPNEKINNRVNTIGMLPTDHSLQLLLDGLPSPFGTRLDSFQPFLF